MQRRKTSVWTPDNDPRARRQRQENQPQEKESQPRQTVQSEASKEPSGPETPAAQEPKPHMAGRLAADKPKPKPKVQPQVKPEPQDKPAPNEPKEVTETQAKVKEDKPKASKGKRKRKPLRRGGRSRAPIGDQRAIAYFDKQVREKTPMVFIGYGETVDCTIIKGLVFEWLLSVNEERDKRKKTDFSCCYKQQEGEKILATMVTDLSIVDQKLEPIIPRKDRYKVNDEILKTSRASKSPITVALRTGQVFSGYVDWFTRFDIALILSNRGKVKIFRHGLYDVKVDAPAVKDEE